MILPLMELPVLTKRSPQQPYNYENTRYSNSRKSCNWYFNQYLAIEGHEYNNLRPLASGLNPWTLDIKFIFVSDPYRVSIKSWGQKRIKIHGGVTCRCVLPDSPSNPGTCKWPEENDLENKVLALQIQVIKWSVSFCCTLVEHMANDPEVVGLIPTGCWAFFCQ